MLYRSGESEYRLNGVPCRLKDITSLFLDTGIGADSYAIIALNMVEDLLSDREQARRKMFEQAAGVSKYKARKHETQLKLEATTADLDRVEDLLYEIEDQLKKLEKQAAAHQKILRTQGRIQNLSIELAVQNLARHQKNYKELKAKSSAKKTIIAAPRPKPANSKPKWRRCAKATPTRKPPSANNNRRSTASPGASGARKTKKICWRKNALSWSKTPPDSKTRSSAQPIPCAASKAKLKATKPT
jgi:hypothetical protein